MEERIQRDERKLKEQKMQIDQLVKFIKGIPRKGETPQKILAHPLLVSQEEVGAVDVLRCKVKMVCNWVEQVLVHAKSSLKVAMTRYTTWEKLIRSMHRVQKRHEELLEHIKVETSYFRDAERMTTKEIVEQKY